MKNDLTITMKNSLGIVAQAYARKYDVVISFHGSSAYTNGKDIVLPSYIADTHNLNAIWGLIAHEASHIKHTEFSYDFLRGKLHKTLVNVLEDLRIERLICQEFPGVFYTLNETANYFFQNNLTVKFDDSADMLENFINYCILYAQYKVSKRSVFKEHFEEVEAFIKTLLSNKQINKINEIIHDSVDLESTRKVALKAWMIIEIISKNEDKTEDQQEDQEGIGSNLNKQEEEQNIINENSQDNFGDCSGNGEKNGFQPDLSRENKDDIHKEIKNCMESFEQADEGLIKSRFDLMEKFKKLLSNESETIKNSPKSSLFKIPTVKKVVGSSSEAVKSYYDSLFIDEIYVEAIKVKRALKKIVDAKINTLGCNKQSGLKLNAKKLSNVALNDLHVFKRNKQIIRPTSAFHLLLDISSSMDCLQEESQKITATFACALSSYTNISLGVSYYSSILGRVDIHEVLQQGNKFNNKLINNFFLVPRGYTPTAEALKYAGGVLLNDKNEKKVIILITDGVPDCINSYKEMLVKLKNINIELIIILLEHQNKMLTNCGTSLSFFKESHDKLVTVNQLSELSPQLIKAIGSHIL